VHVQPTTRIDTPPHNPLLYDTHPHPSPHLSTTTTHAHTYIVNSFTPVVAFQIPRHGPLTTRTTRALAKRVSTANVARVSTDGVRAAVTTPLYYTVYAYEHTHADWTCAAQDGTLVVDDARSQSRARVD